MRQRALASLRSDDPRASMRLLHSALLGAFAMLVLSSCSPRTSTPVVVAENADATLIDAAFRAAAVSAPFRDSLAALHVDPEAHAVAAIQFSSELNDDYLQYLQRVLLRSVDCPDALAVVGRRLGRPVFPLEAVRVLRPGERTDCDAEVGRRALSRVQQRLANLPRALASAATTGAEYIRARRTFQSSQCEEDLDAMDNLYTAYVASVASASLFDENTLFDVRHVLTGPLAKSVEGDITDDGVTLRVEAMHAANGDPHLSVQAVELPPPPEELAWKARDFTSADRFGYTKVRYSMPYTEVPERAELQPLPVQATPLSLNWVREHKTNVSTGDYGVSWPIADGYDYCSHRLDVVGNNNVCANQVEVSNSGIVVTATIKSGSVIDQWRGWLRLEGELRSIARGASRCQRRRAACRLPSGAARLVEPDGVCRSAGPVTGSCFIRTDGASPECWSGSLTNDNRCIPTRRITCPY